MCKRPLQACTCTKYEVVPMCQQLFITTAKVLTVAGAHPSAPQKRLPKYRGPPGSPTRMPKCAVCPVVSASFHGSLGGITVGSAAELCAQPAAKSAWNSTTTMALPQEAGQSAFAASAASSAPCPRRPLEIHRFLPRGSRTPALRRCPRLVQNLYQSSRLRRARLFLSRARVRSILPPDVAGALLIRAHPRPLALRVAVRKEPIILPFFLDHGAA